MPVVTGYTESNLVIAYENLMRDGVVVASGADPDFPVENCFNGFTNDFYKTAAAGTTTIDITFTQGQSADYFAFAKTDAWQFSGTIKLQYFDGVSYIDVSPTITPNDNSVRVFLFDVKTSTQWRVTITATDQVSFADISFGKALRPERGVWVGDNPPEFSNADKFTNVRSSNGNFIGNSIVRRGIKFSLPIEFASNAWIRDNYPPMYESITRYPFYVVWNSAYYGNEDCLAWLAGDVSPPSQSQHRFMSFTIPCRGIK